MFRFRDACAAIGLTLTLAAPTAQAHEFLYTVELAGIAGSPGTGSATILLDLDLVTLDLDVSFSGLTSPSTSVFIHCCTAAAGAGDALRATALPAPVGFALGVLSGSFTP